MILHHQQQISEQAAKKSKNKKAKGKGPDAAAIKKLDVEQLKKVSLIVFKMLELRHKIKMNWFDVNKEEDEEVKQEELPYEQQQEKLEKKLFKKKLAEEQTDQMNKYFTALSFSDKDTKIKE